MAKENYSKKRVAILEALQNTKVHPTAEWVYKTLKTEHPNLSLGTVYRNINKFCEDNKLKSVGTFAGQEHFDACMEPHGHFVCEKCSAIIDIDETFFTENNLNILAEKYNIKIKSEEVLFRGICIECKN